VSVAATYAEALYESAVDQGAVPEVAAQLTEFRDAVAKNSEFETRVKKDVIVRLLDGAHPLVANFMQVLLDRGRADELSDITDGFTDRVAAAEGRLRVKIRTAIPLPDDLRARLVARISELTGSAVDIETIVDPAIVGGLVIETDGSVVDASVRARLADLRQAMLHTSVRDAVVAESA
jgi:F-type H+-transporting ATPase subunit delta